MTEKTSVAESRRLFRWGLFTQLVLVGHTAIAVGLYLAQMLVPAVAVTVSLCAFAYVAIAIGFEAGRAWPRGHHD